jgi:hypothetical protein
MPRQRGTRHYVEVPLTQSDLRRVRLILVDAGGALGHQCAILIHEALDARDKAARDKAPAAPKP